MAGGTEIIVEADQLSSNPKDNFVTFTSTTFGGSIPGPELSGKYSLSTKYYIDNNEFNSNTGTGKLQYTTPSIETLYEQPWESFQSYDSLTFEIGVISHDPETSETVTSKCTSENIDVCKITMNRAFTPILYYTAPSVVFNGMEIAMQVDPKSSLQYKNSEDWPFTEVRIDGVLLDFEGYIDETSHLSSNQKNQIKGIVQDQDPSSNSSMNMKFVAGNAHQLAYSVYTCAYDNSQCYKIKTIPKINSISASKGYTTGGQTLTITGFGLHAELDKIDVQVAQQVCHVQSVTLDEITCETSETGSETVPNQDYIGQNGVRRRIYKNPNQSYMSINTYTQYDYVEDITTSFEINQRSGDYYGSTLSGYFKAPATTNYRFFSACNNYCKVYLSNVNNDSSLKQEIISVGSTGHRNYRSSEDSGSVWISLTKDENYYLELQHIANSGNDYASLAVEIEQTEIENHHHARRQVQQLQINPNNIRELTRIQVDSPMDDGLILYRFITEDMELTEFDPIPIKSTAQEIKDHIESYWWDNFDAPIKITQEMWDVNGELTDDFETQHTAIYNITVERAIDGVTVRIAPRTRIDTETVHQVIPPYYTGQLSTPPIKGSFTITCYTTTGQSHTTDEMSSHSIPSHIKAKIIEACPEYRDLIEVYDGKKYNYYDDGRDIIIDFVGIKHEVQQFTINSGNVDPLDGHEIQIENFVAFPYSSNLFYNEIPFEWLYTNETNPQVTVNINGLPAACTGLQCDYNYIIPIAEILAFSIEGTTLTIEGTDFPSDIESITLAYLNCEVISSTTTSIECSLTNEPTIGSWYPEVIDKYGRIPISNDVGPLVIDIDITSVEVPQYGLNPEGSQLIKIHGNNFPSESDTRSTISITFEDGTNCIVTSQSSQKIECQTEEFSVEGQTLQLIVNINNAIDDTHTVDIGYPPVQITVINPAIVSPVLKTYIEINIEDTFDGTLIRDDLTVHFVSQEDPSYKVPARITEVDNNVNKIIVRFGGAVSGLYDISIFSLEHGQFDAQDYILETVGKITNFYPQSGSIYGGTIVTIDGYVFSDDPLDNNVKVGKTDCLVFSSSPDQIKCRTNPKYSGSNIQNFLVFLKAAEEAQCEDPSGSCMFEWLDSDIPMIEDVGVVFDTSLNEYVINIQGVEFSGEKEDIELFIDNEQLLVTSKSNETVSAVIDHIYTTRTQNIKIYFLEGVPSGYEILQEGIELEPKLIDIFPPLGSVAGSIITATVKGVGVKTENIDLVNVNGTSICQQVQIIDYSKIECHTKAMEIDQATEISVKFENNIYPCANSDTSYCKYETDPSMPVVSSMEITDEGSSITFTGTNFFTNGYQAQVSYLDVVATSVTIVSASEVIAHFESGVPVNQEGSKPTLLFDNVDEGHYALIQEDLISDFQIISYTTDLECSFSGGCVFTIEAPGLTSLLKSTDSNVTVCDQLCVFLEDSSNSTHAQCELPALATSHSLDSYGVSNNKGKKGKKGNNGNNGNQGKPSRIFGTPFSSNPSKTELLFEGKNHDGFSDSSAPCYFGTEMKFGHIGVLERVRIFLSNKRNRFSRENYQDQLIFQGSNDGENYEDIFTVDSKVHPGWNTYRYGKGEELKYKYFRFYGLTSEACEVGEAWFDGSEVIDDNSGAYNCTPQVNIGEDFFELENGTVTYSDEQTLLLTSIYPKYGSVKGGDTITFYGDNFVADTTQYTILLDGIECDPIEATTSYVKCITNPRPGLVEESTLYISISEKGEVATQDFLFIYANYWSDEDTWGGEFAPLQGDSVHVPKGLYLLVDVDSTPVLGAVVVEGTLIFPSNNDENHLQTFDAHYIFIRGGKMEIGTEEHPYNSKIIITMHGNKQSPEIPIYGNKCIGVRAGTLELHGQPRTPTWTELSTTANAGDNQITLNQQVDWKVDEKIVIAPTGYDNHEAEERTIVNIDNTDPTKPIITLDKALNYKHYAGVETYGDQELEMRAEVGLLTRNVIFRGDPETSELNQYGAHILLHSHGDDSVSGKIEYVEFQDVGQAHQLGRYPIHFHMIGEIHNSYIKGNSIHHSFNRACTMHGVHYLQITDNFAYNIKGHTFFIEDAIETNNLLENNLAILTKRTFSLLNTDTTPGSFWITNPDNLFRNNHAAGSDRYGFWFDLQQHPTGPSFDPNICPINTKLGEFQGNVAHSNGRYGLRIFRAHVSRTFPCQPLTFNSTNTEDPYHQNPLITAEYRNFIGYKNGRNGAIAERVGDVRFIGFKTADNILAGIEFSLTDQTMDGTAQINGALIVAHSANDEDKTLSSSAHGIITPRTENFQVHNVDFYNFDYNQMAALGSCSHCFHSAATDSGARTVKFSNLYFDASVTRKIRYQQPYRAIYLDLDGSLTGLGANTWATPYWEHNEQPQCEVNLPIYDGLVCDSTVQRNGNENFKMG